MELLPEQLQKELILNGDFLALTRQFPEKFGTSFSFQITNNQQKINVKVLETGLICFEPVEQITCRDIVLSSGVHGNETAPIEICADLIKQLLLGKLYLAERVLFIFGNPVSMNIAKRFVEENMNRLFSGGHSQDQGQGAGLINKERIRAKLLEDTVRSFYLEGSKLSTARTRCHYDLHTAIRGSKNDKFAVYPFRHGKPWKKEQLSFMQACGVDTILLSHSPTTTFSYFSSNEFDADAFTVELGKVMPFGENDMTKFTQVKATLTALISGEHLQLKPFDEADFHIYEIHQIINRTQENFQLNFADDVENFTDFPKGSVIAMDGEKEVITQVEGEAIIFPNANVAIGQRALLTVIPAKI
ncbi:succinylglutamate desuccinylase [Thalassotalea profundi]|uniref:Succinylglutamate desuccinylase n=1 Tax=Thalassotalea profundi TaxID=2036687 RepID=A0ABQ3IEQ9_9GAMM|nr:succinylglutamate desuccinylase [Thalassotalea profundi]GHE77352.1 succinylglutamate desuccinylase [Thalassotalea profundi]